MESESKQDMSILRKLLWMINHILHNHKVYDIDILIQVIRQMELVSTPNFATLQSHWVSLTEVKLRLNKNNGRFDYNS